MTEIKVCGITRLDDALCAASCGVNALGFIFHQPSPRYITPERAGEIIAALPAGVVTLGVFVNRPAAEVEETAAFCGLDLIQLHGDESPEYCRRFPPGRIIKAFSPAPGEEIGALSAYAVRAFLVDARSGGLYGGTGQRADWGLAATIAKRYPLILAGGLGEGNIGEALAAVAPQAVDLNSGVERAPGIKDQERLRRVVAMIRRAGFPGTNGLFRKGLLPVTSSPPPAGG